MKISKLFHWLYATLMFLPLIFYVPSAFYYGFNEHATNTETTTINYKYESNEVNNLSDLVIGNVYAFNCLGMGISDILSNNEYLQFQLLSDLHFNEGVILDEFMNTYLSSNCYIQLDGSSYVYVYQSEQQLNDNDFLVSISLSETSFANNCIVQLIDFDFETYQYFSYTDYNEIESVTVNTDDTISNKMYLAWESLWDLPVFAWTKTCFLSAGFTYISGLFGVSATNSLNYVFGYWITISICWLVFDLLIYVPNLAHRWLDKGAVE